MDTGVIYNLFILLKPHFFRFLFLFPFLQPLKALDSQTDGLKAFNHVKTGSCKIFLIIIPDDAEKEHQIEQSDCILD